MKFRLVYCLSMLVPAAVGCGGGNGNPDGGGTGPVGNVVMRDVNSYTSVSSLTIPVIETASGADLQVCWADIVKDILCHDVSATMSTCANLSSFKFGSTLMPATDYVTAANKSYMMLFTTGTVQGSGARTMVFLDPVATSTNMNVAAPASGCDILSFQADLSTPTPLAIPATGEWVVDWSQITKDSMGNAVNFQFIDSLMVGYYEGKTVADLQAMFKDIDRIATTLWTVDILPKGRKYMDLHDAKTDAGVAFPGFTGTGVYAVALLCSSCQVPAPVALSILDPIQ